MKSWDFEKNDTKLCLDEAASLTMKHNQFQYKIRRFSVRMKY